MAKVTPYLVAIVVIALLCTYLLKEAGLVFGGGLFCAILLLLLLVFMADEKRKPRTSVHFTTQEPSSLQLEKLQIEVRSISSAIQLLTVQPKTRAIPESDDLKHAVSTLAHELGVREKDSQRLSDLLIQRNHKRILARLASIRETADFTRRINAAGNLKDKEALEQIILEIEAAIADLGMEILHIAPGARVAELPNGSFTILTALPPETPESAGTVKESLSDAVFIKDDTGKALFIAPAKLRVFKL